MPSLTYSYTLTLEGQRYGEGLQGGGAGPSRVYAEDSVYEGAASLVVWSPRGVKLDYTSSSVNLSEADDKFTLLLRRAQLSETFGVGSIASLRGQSCGLRYCVAPAASDSAC